MSQLRALLRFEIVKLRGRAITWVPYVVLALVVCVIVAVFYTVQFKHQLTIFQQANMGVTRKEDFVNGYFMAVHSMKPVFELMLPIFIAVASGLMVAGEAESGTLRACLIRPVRRRDLILAKFTVLSAYALSLCVFFLALDVVMGIVNFGTGSLYTINMLFNNGELGASMVPVDEVPMRFALAALIATMGMMVLGAMALMISALVETSAMAYVLTLAVYFTEMILRVLPMLDWLYPYLFVTHMMRWQQCFYSYVKTGDIYVSLVHLAFYLIVFLSAAVLLFNEKDIKT